MKALVRILLAPALVCVAVSPSAAQLDQGRLVGTVTDAQGAVLPGVTVTTAAPSLIGTQVTVTEADGRYRFPALPAGQYVLTFELSGFRTLRRAGVVLAVGQILTVDAQLELATLEETVTVTADSPIVDVESTKIGTELSGTKLQNVPTATDMWSTLSQSPGVRMRSYDVGGSHKSQEGSYEGFGVRGQNRIITEGVDHTEGTGASGGYDDFFAVDEVSVSAAGGDVEVPNAGVHFLATVKSGGNQFKGLYNLTYEGKNFVGDNIDDATRARGFTGNKNLLFWEGHVDLGGPIKRDKVWFYVAYNYYKIDKTISGVPRELATDLGIFHSLTIKGTHKASKKDTLVGFYNYGTKLKPFRGLSASTPAESVLAQDTPWWQIKGEHQRVWTNRLFTDVRLNHSGFRWPMVPKVDPKVKPPRFDAGTGLNSGAGWNAFTIIRNQPQVHVTITYYVPEKLGSHDLKTGFQYRNDQLQFGFNGNSGPIRYLDLNGQVDRVEFQDVNTFESFGDSWKVGDDRNQTHAAFVQDRWRPTNRLVLTLGLRYDRQRPHYEQGVRDPVLKDIFPAVKIPGATIFTRHTLSPRIGIAYNLIGEGRAVVKGFYGRYYDNYADRFAEANPGGLNTKIFNFLDRNGNGLYDGPDELGALLATSGGAATRVDPKMRRPHVDEVSTSVERQFWRESSARVAYVRKMVRNQFDAFNITREGQFVVPTTVTVGIRNYNDPVVVPRTFNVLTIPAALAGVFDNVITSFPDGNYNYDTLQFAFNKRFRGNLFIQSSFDYQWRNELRNTSASTSPLSTDPFGVGYFQNVRPEVPNRQKSTNWQGRLMGRYQFPFQVGLGMNLRVQSGFNYSRTIAATVPNLGTQVFFLEGAKNNRSDTVPILDIRFDKALKSERYQLKLLVDVFNVLNSSAVTNFFLANGANYNRIIATLDPRTAMVGVRFEF